MQCEYNNGVTVVMHVIHQADPQLACHTAWMYRLETSRLSIAVSHKEG